MTIGDLERWLKGAAQGKAINLYASNGKLYADINGGSHGSSKVSLAHAIENAMEELRRSENGQQSARAEEKPVGTVPAVVTTAMTAAVTCPKCGGYGYTSFIAAGGHMFAPCSCKPATGWINVTVTP